MKYISGGGAPRTPPSVALGSMFNEIEYITKTQSHCKMLYRFILNHSKLRIYQGSIFNLIQY